MTRLNIVLLIAVLASALYLVHTQYESRRIFVEVDKAVAQARRIELDNELLQVEKREQATPLRVDKLAREQLKMRPATPAITQYVTSQYVTYNASAVAAAPSSTPGHAVGASAATAAGAKP